MTLVEKLVEDVRTRHPRSLQGVEEARAVDPERFDAIAEAFLEWGLRAKGDDQLPVMVDAFVQFSNDVIFAQARYETTCAYENKSFDEIRQAVYSRREVMDDYLWGVYLTNFLWAHHMEITLFFRNRFVMPLPERLRILELAPGHGGWGISLLTMRTSATLTGYDISPSSIAIAATISAAAGVADRAIYCERNALDSGGIEAAGFDAAISCFLLEHLEDPGALVRQVAYALKPGGRAFLTGALTAAQIDHIFEFVRESELIALCEAAGLRVIETFSGNPRRTLPKARFVPRSMALIAIKPGEGH